MSSWYQEKNKIRTGNNYSVCFLSFFGVEGVVAAGIM